MMTRQLNPQALAIEDAETELKAYLWRGYLQGKNKAQLKSGVDDIVKRLEKQLTSDELKRTAPVSMYRLADRVWEKIILLLGISGALAASTIAYVTGQRKTPPKKLAPLSPTASIAAKEQYVDYETSAKGVPLNKYSKEYTKQVRSVYEQLAEENALDLDDVSGKNSLRNQAEMIVRQEFHENELQELTAKGARLVVVSAHADCSDRCFPYQGRVYSLDGTSGQTADGRSYVPLEEATNNPRDRYVTKAGRVYQNGLFGFNCRHRMYEYKDGMAIPKVSRATQQRENAVNTRQREYEAEIRRHRQLALYAEQSGDESEYRKERDIAIRLNKQYIAFSRRNNRAYYPDRTQIFDK